MTKQEEIIKSLINRIQKVFTSGDYEEINFKVSIRKGEVIKEIKARITK